MACSGSRCKNTRARGREKISGFSSGSSKLKKLIAITAVSFAKKGTLLASLPLDEGHFPKKATICVPKKQLEKEFVQYACKRVRELKSTFKQIVENSDSRAVHDFRKATRHLQTIVDAIAIRRHSRKTLEIRRGLQKCRHALGEWRDDEVVLKELKKAERKARTRNERQCWSQVAERTAKEHRLTLKKFFSKLQVATSSCHCG